MASGNPETSINIELAGRSIVPRSPGRPKDQGLTLRRREEIIVAASKLFAQHGFRATDLNQVAEQLGVAKGTIYNYFPSKAELFMACVELGKAGLQQAHEEAVAGADNCPLAQIRQAVAGYFHFFDENPHHIELMMQARGEFKDGNWLSGAPETHECQAFTPLIELLSRGVEMGVIRPLSIKGMHDVLLNLVVGAIFSKHIGKTSMSLSDQTAEILEIVFKGIVQVEPEKNGS